MTEAERLMGDDVRSGEASAEVHCLACEQTFMAALWQPRMRCPNCDAIGYPDQAGYNLIPLTWLCPRCEHSNDGMTNFCTNCGEGQVSRCLKCESPVYGAGCMRCGAAQAPILQRKRLNQKREQRFRPIRAHIISERARLDPTPPPSFNPAYGVSGWRSLVVDMPEEEEEEAVQPVQQAQAPQPVSTMPSPPKKASPARRKRLSGNVLGRVAFGLLCIIIGGFVLLSEQTSLEPDLLLTDIVNWVDLNIATPVGGMIQTNPEGTSVIFPIIIGIVFLMVFFAFGLRMFINLSRQIIK